MSAAARTSERALGWRAPILEYFTAEIAEATRLTIVADPDYLLTEQEILGELRERGFDLVPFEDHVAFRFEYESRYRQIWDRLRPEGAFLNIDLVCAPDEAIDARYQAIAEAEREARGEPPPSESRRHQSHLEPLDSHLTWLREAGFEHVECFWKRLGTALFGGFRSVEPSPDG